MSSPTALHPLEGSALASLPTRIRMSLPRLGERRLGLAARLLVGVALLPVILPAVAVASPLAALAALLSSHRAVSSAAAGNLTSNTSRGA